MGDMNETNHKRRLSSIDDSTSMDNSSCVTSRESEHIKLSSTSTYPAIKSIKQSDLSAPSICYTCNLPPTCNPPNHKPPRFENPSELESHHRTHHAFTCSSTGCNRIFPSQHFLDLHLNEVHDPILQVQREKYEAKIFRCFEHNCEKAFSSPKNRRLHLIDFHGYPRTFFFSLPNQGLNDLYRKFGSGVSLVRPNWKASAASSNTPSKSSAGDSKVTPHTAPKLSISESRSSLGSIGNDDQKKHIDGNKQPIDSVIESIQQLSLVPRQIQFGKKAGSKSFQR
ncbi:hypothetical protein PTTG_00328 [Puccinia triticina 1-1 BBBD Race 1]|uniref:C2H2-type domain-containing protein n=2 Tax=Puccinia triticina TaxID=208348 RepID=A0A180H0K9_PUCT1|nr:uncharacterized protein PtA15_8A407 [Puccinia triticina]OAV98281.1 hypothetical protein PTTG_00328 [Puccinia triticina 1-1 BBBD Race 1]WAQ87503.1 hypothetical protein PtA15_8A407 [Puccinia triticina]WAR57361.1 hypothetical protein PtB15_8B408 [Puccinia triticina]